MRAYCRQRLGQHQVTLIEQCAFRDVPTYLALSDLVVIPQRNTPTTTAQVPAKVFDAMAMAKPIIASAVSDLPEILEDCGWLTQPEDPKMLAANIRYAMEHSQEAVSLGRQARSKCVARYSYNAMGKILQELITQLLNHSPS